MESISKFNDLITGQTYTVLGYSDPINSLYGLSYVLIVTGQNSTDQFELRSTNLLTDYISNIEPKGKFTFVVNERNKVKYPVIENYKKERKFTMLS